MFELLPKWRWAARGRDGVQASTSATQRAGINRGMSGRPSGGRLSGLARTASGTLLSDKADSESTGVIPPKVSAFIPTAVSVTIIIKLFVH
jgi:hypothetical protein